MLSAHPRTEPGDAFCGLSISWFSTCSRRCCPIALYGKYNMKAAADTKTLVPAATMIFCFDIISTSWGRSGKVAQPRAPRWLFLDGFTNHERVTSNMAYRRCWWTLFRNSKSGKRRRERRGKRERKGGRKGRKERKKVGSQKPIELRFWELIENKSNFKLVFSLHHVEGGCRREREFLPGSRDSPLVFWAVAHIWSRPAPLAQASRQRSTMTEKTFVPAYTSVMEASWLGLHHVPFLRFRCAD